MPFCDECGSKLPVKSKFCAKCGAAVNNKAAQSQQAAQAAAAAATQPQPQAASPAQATPTQAQKAAQSNSAWKVLGILLGLFIAFVILVGVFGYDSSNRVTTGSGYDGNGNNLGTTSTCNDKAGSVTCGYCDASTTFSGNQYAGKCRYCPNGYACSGEICSSELTCKPASQPSGGNGGATATPGGNNGGNGGNGGGGTLTNFQFDARTGCPVQGSTSSWGNSDLECSQWIESQRCSIQVCTCTYPQMHGQVVRAYYRTSDGAYYPCSGSDNGRSCTNSAVAAAEHCGPPTQGPIVWG